MTQLECRQRATAYRELQTSDVDNGRGSPAAADKQATSKQMASLHIKYASGLIRGALSGLGVTASVSAEVSEVPKCQFTIRIMQ